MDTDLNLNLANITTERMTRILEHLREYCSYGNFYAVPDQKQYFSEGHLREFNSGFMIYQADMISNIQFDSEMCINDQVALAAYFQRVNFTINFLPHEWNCMPKFTALDCSSSFFVHRHYQDKSYVKNNLHQVDVATKAIRRYDKQLKKRKSAYLKHHE